MPGTLLNDCYRLEAQLGKGGMGVVYRAFDTLLERAVAVKVLESGDLGPSGRARLLREARAAAQLNHPHIVAIMKRTILPLSLVFLLLCGCTFPGRISFPKIDRHPDRSGLRRGALEAIPSYDPMSGSPWQVDLRSYDLSALNLRGSLDDLWHATFDDQTQWPPAERMPPEYDWQQIMELGKNPGLGIHTLHARGITGQGVGVAIVDTSLLVDHQEYVDQLQLYEEIGPGPLGDAQMHGVAVASIAVGKTVGVAPAADLYFIAAFTNTLDFTYPAQAIRRILEVNEQLPKERKIRVISISVDWNPGDPGYEEMAAAAAAAKEAGMLLIGSGAYELDEFRVMDLGRAPLADPDNFQSYELGFSWAAVLSRTGQSVAERMAGSLFVPVDSRATASPTWKTDYVFYREGGWSWAVPYIAGVYALAAQVDPSITPDRFWELALQTGRMIEVQYEGETVSLGPILDPVALIEAVQE